MKQAELLDLAESVMNEAIELLGKKSNDYANEKDALSNFKLVSEIVGIPVEKVVLVFLATKIVRIGELSNNKTPNNESVEDSLKDNINYSLLYSAILKDKVEDVDKAEKTLRDFEGYKFNDTRVVY